MDQQHVNDTIEQARKDLLAGTPGNLTFVVEVKRANGTVEQHTLTGRVSAANPPENAPC